jgi:hypothetical protein
MCQLKNGLFWSLLEHQVIALIAQVEVYMNQLIVTEMHNRELTAVIGAYTATATTDPPNLNPDATFGMPAFT